MSQDHLSKCIQSLFVSFPFYNKTFLRICAVIIIIIIIIVIAIVIIIIIIIVVVVIFVVLLSLLFTALGTLQKCDWTKKQGNTDPYVSLPKSNLLYCENLDLNLSNKKKYRWLTYQQGHTYSQWAHLVVQQIGILTSEHAYDHYTQFFAVDLDERSVSLSHLWIQNNFLVGHLLHVWHQHTPVTNKDSRYRHSIEIFCGCDCRKCCPWLRS